MPRQGSETRRMQRSAYVRLDAALADCVDAAAARRGLTSAAWLRGLAADALAADPAQARLTRRRAPPRPAPTEHVRALVALQEVVAELGGALVRTAVRTREGGHDFLHDEVEALIPGIKAASADLVGLILEASR